MFQSGQDHQDLLVGDGGRAVPTSIGFSAARGATAEATYVGATVLFLTREGLRHLFLGLISL